jgi:hypothetical protein
MTIHKSGLGLRQKAGHLPTEVVGDGGVLCRTLMSIKLKTVGTAKGIPNVPRHPSALQQEMRTGFHL